MIDDELLAAVQALERQLQKLKPPPKPKHWLAAMLDEVADAVALPRSEITGECKEAEAVGARCGIAAAMSDAGWSNAGIGRTLGRDHTSVISILRAKVRDQYFRRPIVRVCYEIARKHVPGAKEAAS